MRLLIWIMFCAAMIGLLTLLAVTGVHAQSVKCALVAPVEARIVDGGGSWVELAPSQVQFMRGVYANVPAAAGTVPIGDQAFLGGGGKEPTVSVYFVDGPFVCGKLNIKPMLLNTLLHEGAGDAVHVGDPS